MREGGGLTSHVFDKAPTASFSHSRAHRVRYRSVRPFIGCRKIIHHAMPCFRLRGSLRGCRSEIRLLDLPPATVLCAKDCWVKRGGGLVAAPPPLLSSGCRTRLSLDATCLFPRSLGLGASTTVAGGAYQWYENHLAPFLRLSNCAWMPAWGAFTVPLGSEGSLSRVAEAQLPALAPVSSSSCRSLFWMCTFRN